MRKLIIGMVLVVAAFIGVHLWRHPSNNAVSGNQTAQPYGQTASAQTKQLRFSPQIRREDQQMLLETWEQIQLIRREVSEHQDQKH
jgi:hypothetical protein